MGFTIRDDGSTGRIGTVTPKTVLEIRETSQIDPSLIIKDGDYIWFHGEKYEKIVPPKPQTLYGLIEDWWADIFTVNANDDAETSIENLVDRIAQWLPKEQSAQGSQNVYVECTVEGFNDCLNKIKGKLR